MSFIDKFSMPVFLAPMAGITDLPMRDLVQSFGVGLVVSEMVISQEMAHGRPYARAKAELGLNVDNSSVQIAGTDANLMAISAGKLVDMGAKIIDINMGCPAKTVTNSAAGSALMRVPDQALTIIDAVIKAVDIPVTLKMRLGWDEQTINATHIAKRAENAGIQMLTIHGRTRCQFYKGKANWNAIKEVVDAVTIPVIANGDITNGASAKLALKQSGAAGVMVGRGIKGRPWQIAKIHAELTGTDYIAPRLTERVDIILAHYRAILSFYGVEIGVKMARKHLGWYLDDMPNQKETRHLVLREKNPNCVISHIENIKQNGDMLSCVA